VARPRLAECCDEAVLVRLERRGDEEDGRLLSARARPVTSQRSALAFQTGGRMGGRRDLKPRVGRSSSTRWGHHAVHPQVHHHLSVVIVGVRQRFGDECDARGRPALEG